MVTHSKTLTVDTAQGRVSYHNITDEVRKVVAESKVKNGICVIQSQHTTCSVIFEEMVHDTDFNGTEFLQVDLDRILDRIVPRELSENSNYRYPGPKHVDFLYGMNDPAYPPDPGSILNGDAHIRASFFGASETIIVRDSDLLTGTVGYIYFIDFDQTRPRTRKCHVMVMGE
ncbi:MAG: YjbQ family protein [Bifidobacteriaceae bacterium]|jgi:thiamine phosphate synthase YjbQ (UPF0047 family)|nr:YjbQ family protein [Bifidobacteriaceae bacterium]